MLVEQNSNETNKQIHNKTPKEIMSIKMQLGLSANFSGNRKLLQKASANALNKKSIPAPKLSSTSTS